MYTLIEFFWYGLKYGLLGGALLGSLVFPVIGTVLGASIGIMVGCYVGVLLGIVIKISNTFFLHEATDLIKYRRRLTCAGGVIAGFSILLPLLTGIDYSTLNPTLALLLATASVVGLNVADAIYAYITDYATDLRDPNYRETLVSSQAEDEALDRFFQRQYARKVFLSAIPLLAGTFLWIGALGLEHNAVPMLLSVFLVLYNAYIIAKLNSSLVKRLNHLWFGEYFPDMSPNAYKNWLTIITFLTTLVYGSVVSGLVFAPVAAFLAAWTARQYADFRYATLDKAKRKNDFAAPERLNADVASEAIEHDASEKPTFDHRAQ